MRMGIADRRDHGQVDCDLVIGRPNHHGVA
jgi:hypothetical protein